MDKDRAHLPLEAMQLLHSTTDALNVVLLYRD